MLETIYFGRNLKGCAMKKAISIGLLSIITVLVSNINIFEQSELMKYESINNTFFEGFRDGQFNRYMVNSLEFIGSFGGRLFNNLTLVERFGGELFHRYVVSNLNIDGRGNRIVQKRGGRLRATLEVFHDCPECGGAINQIIVGIGGEEKAQSCIWNGGQSSSGWQTARFELEVPDTPGIYYVQTRYAQAYGCDTSLDWWKIDRPNGPTSDSNIGYIHVTGETLRSQRKSMEIDKKESINEKRSMNEVCAIMTTMPDAEDTDKFLKYLHTSPSEMINKLNSMSSNMRFYDAEGYGWSRGINSSAGLEPLPGSWLIGALLMVCDQSNDPTSDSNIGYIHVTGETLRSQRKLMEIDKQESINEVCAIMTTMPDAEDTDKFLKYLYTSPSEVINDLKSMSFNMAQYDAEKYGWQNIIDSSGGLEPLPGPWLIGALLMVCDQ